MRELTGKRDLQLAKDVLCAFEAAHYPNRQACSDIQESLYWFVAEDEYFSADFGMLLRGEYEDVRIFETEEDGWLPLSKGTAGWTLTAFVRFREKTYFFYTR